MIYLLTLGWPWFAGAAALGAFIGFLTFRREGAGVSRSGNWVAAAGLLLLAAAGVAAWFEALDGRAATTLDIALLAGLAYAIGLPLGGAARSLGRKPARPALPAPTPLLAAPAVSAPTPRPAPPIIVPAAATSTPAAPSQTSVPRPAGARKPSPGLRPAMLAEPRAGGPDDLARIKGVGPKSVERDKWIQQARALLAGAETKK